MDRLPHSHCYGGKCGCLNHSPSSCTINMFPTQSTRIHSAHRVQRQKHRVLPDHHHLAGGDSAVTGVLGRLEHRLNAFRNDLLGAIQVASACSSPSSQPLCARGARRSVGSWAGRHGLLLLEALRQLPHQLRFLRPPHTIACLLPLTSPGEAPQLTSLPLLDKQDIRIHLLWVSAARPHSDGPSTRLWLYLRRFPGWCQMTSVISGESRGLFNGSMYAHSGPLARMLPFKRAPKTLTLIVTRFN